MSKPTGIGLAELINEIKRELLSVDTDAQEKVPLFSIDEVELELQVTVTKEGSAGLSVQVIQIGGQFEQQHVQRVKVKLTPLLEKEERLRDFQSKYPEMWKSLQEKQLHATIKGSEEGSLDDLYGN
jgi:hypothetical protein